MHGGGRGCYAGRPIAVKCPKCKRGKFGYPRKDKGVHVTNDQKSNPRIRHHLGGTLTRIECLDCGHEWWTTLVPKRMEPTA